MRKISIMKIFLLVQFLSRVWSFQVGVSCKVEEPDIEKEVKKSPRRKLFPQGNPKCHKKTGSEDEQQKTQAGPSRTKHTNAEMDLVH